MMATDTTTATVLMMNTSMRSPRPWPILSSQLTDRVPHDGAIFFGGEGHICCCLQMLSRGAVEPAFVTYRVDSCVEMPELQKNLEYQPPLDVFYLR